jgi:Tol biopolymer transport system component
MLDSSGRTLRHLGTSGRFYSVDLSPDGSSAVVATVDPKLGTSDLWSWDLRRDTSRRLTFTNGIESAAVITPDGARMYFLGTQGPDSDIFETTLDGSQPDRLVAEAPGLQIPCDITPDGKLLLYQTNEDTAADYDLMLLPLVAGSKSQPFLKTPFREAEGRFSPDGRQIAYTSNESGTLQVYARPFPGPGAPRQISAERGFAPVWSADGRRIFFLAGRRIMSADADGRSNPTTIVELPYDIDNFDVSPDGSFIAILGSDPFGAAPNRVIDDWKRLLKDR